MSTMDEVPANKIDLIYKLEGEFTEGVDVFELSPILLSLGQLIQDSNKVLNPGGREIAVNVKPFEEGSFIVDISVFAQSNIQQVIDAVNQDGVRNVKELLEWIGLIGGGSYSLVKLIKFLKGKPKAVEKVSPGEVKFTSKEGNSLTINNKIFSLFNFAPIQNHIAQSVGRSFDIPGVTGVKSYLKEAEAEVVEVTEEEGSYFKEFEEPEVFDESERTKESRATLFLNPRRGDYGGGKGPYYFTISGEEKSKQMEIRDEEFKNKLKTGEYRLHDSDLIEADIIIEQKVKDNQISAVHYHIVKVTDYTKAKEPQNMELFEEPKGEME